MCVQYWPAAKDKSELYGDIEVKILHEEELANFHIRTIKLFKYANSVRFKANGRVRTFEKFQISVKFDHGHH